MWGDRQAEDLDRRLLAQVRRAGTALDVDAEEHARLIAEDVKRCRRAKEEALHVRDLLRSMPD